MLKDDVARDLRVAGALLATSGAVVAGLGWLHMRALVQAYGVICGSGAGEFAHCPACYIGVALMALAAACFARAHPGRLVARCSK